MEKFAVNVPVWVQFGPGRGIVHWGCMPEAPLTVLCQASPRALLDLQLSHLKITHKISTSSLDRPLIS